MAKPPKSQALTDAKKFYKLLLFEASGGNLGTEPEKKNKKETATFGEKKALLGEIIKLAMLEEKASENDEQPSGLDIIRKQLNGDRNDKRRRDFERANPESGADDSSAESDAPSAES